MPKPIETTNAPHKYPSVALLLDKSTVGPTRRYPHPCLLVECLRSLALLAECGATTVVWIIVVGRPANVAIAKVEVAHGLVEVPRNAVVAFVEGNVKVRTFRGVGVCLVYRDFVGFARAGERHLEGFAFEN